MIDRMNAPRPHRPPAAVAPVAAAVVLAALMGLFPPPPGEPEARLLAAKPKAPGKVRVQSVGETSVKLRWRDRAHGERRYEVQHRPQGTNAWETATLKRNSTKFVNRGLELGTVHEHQVRACGRQRCSRWSPVRAQATLLAPFNGPHPDPQCGVLPPGDAFSQDVSGLPADPRSDSYVAQI